MPATSVVTDSTGVARLVCGIGDWFISAQSPPAIAGGVGGVNSTSIEDDMLFWVTGIPKKLRIKIASLFKGSPSTYMAFAHVKGTETEVTLKLNATTPAKWQTELEYTPPVAPVAIAPEVISAEGIARGITTSSLQSPPSIETLPQSPPSIEGGVGGGAPSKALTDSLFGARLAWEDSVREADVWDRWQSEEGVWCQPLEELADTTGWGGDTTLASYYRKARGNWGCLFYLLYRRWPTKISEPTYDEFAYYRTETDRVWRKTLDRFYKIYFGSLSDKDLRDFGTYHVFDSEVAVGFGIAELYESDQAIATSPSGYKLGRFEIDPISWINPRYRHEPNSITVAAAFENAMKLDSLAFDRYKDYVLTPRIDNEPSIPWQNEVIDTLEQHRELLGAMGDMAVLAWHRQNITLEPSPDRLGPPLTPAHCLELHRGTESDVERLYIGLCRIRGIPARRNPVTGQVERWEEGTMEDGKGKMEPGWVAVQVIPKPENKKQKTENRKQKTGRLTLRYAHDAADSSSSSPIYMKDWAVAKWEGNMADVMDFGWHEPFEKISWPQELPKGWYLISSGIRRQDGSAAVKLKWVQLKTMLNNELRFEVQ